MTDPEDLRALWRDQPQETPPMSLAQVHEKATKFQRRIRLRNWIEYVATAFVVVAFGAMAVASPNPFVRLGAGLEIAGVLFVAWQIHRRGSARPVPEAGEGVLALHRAELVRQRDALRSVPLWYLAPMAPGMAVLLSAHALAGVQPWTHAAIPSAVAALVFAAVWRLNAHGARRLQAEIDALDARGTE